MNKSISAIYNKGQELGLNINESDAHDIFLEILKVQGEGLDNAINDLSRIQNLVQDRIREVEDRSSMDVTLKHIVDYICSSGACIEILKRNNRGCGLLPMRNRATQIEKLEKYIGNIESIVKSLRTEIEDYD